MNIGPYVLENNLFLAPMAGVTDLPFRRLCKKMGAGVVVSEMVTSDPSLQSSRKTRLRLAQDFDFETEIGHASDFESKISSKISSKESTGLRVVQIAGSDAATLAQAAISNVIRGAQVIDVNMGCPAKKICNKAAGSALLKDPKLVNSILKAVVAAVDVPVTLKIRTGWDKSNKNAILIATIAEDNGIKSLAVHGRTRACKYAGYAEHDTVALVKQKVSIPVIANGDINSPQTAKKVLEHTKADGLMIGRAAQGRPWIFKEVDFFLKNNRLLPAMEATEIKDILMKHIFSLHQFYGEAQGVRIARKHTSWYLSNNILTDDHSNKPLTHINKNKKFKNKFNTLLTSKEQLNSLERFFEQQ